MESRERSKIVNLANIKLWILDKPANIEPPNIQEAENTGGQKRKYNKKIHEKIPEFQRITRSKTAAENEVQSPCGNPENEINQEVGKYHLATRKMLLT